MAAAHHEGPQLASAKALMVSRRRSRRPSNHEGVLAGAGSAPNILPAIAHQRADLGFAGVARVAYLPVFGGGGVEGKV